MIRSIKSTDEPLVAKFLAQHWGSRQVASRGKVLDAATLPGFLVEEGGEILGLITVHFSADDCEVVTLDSTHPGKGIGRELLEIVEAEARNRKVSRLWLITSNDNTGALAFYQKVGFRIVRIHLDAITEARKLKPQIPLVAENGIPIRDEIELQKLL